MTATIFGATGFIGSIVLQLILQDQDFESVTMFVRNPTGLTHHKLEEYIIDFEQISYYQEQTKADVIFNCLGTTIKKAGSQAAQQRIDRDYPIAIAEVSKENNSGMLLNVSSVGADAQASNFYLKTKGEMEEGVAKAMGQKAFFFRPSFITGQRPEFRLAEKIGIVFMKPIDLLLRGKLSKWHSINANVLAQSMVNAAKNKPKSNILHYDQIV